LARYYRTATVFCAPSTGMESFGIILLEAMASSTPIVASDIEGYRCVITNGVDGLLVPPENPPALAEALVALLNDPARRAAYSSAGRSTVARYDWPVLAGRVMEHYEALRRRIRPHAALARPRTAEQAET
jgi:phosphatidylinositol alpha-mannosyltransferase